MHAFVIICFQSREEKKILVWEAAKKVLFIGPATKAFPPPPPPGA